jgi:hypothetical protein
MLGDLISPLTKGLLLVAFLAIATASLTTYLYLVKRDDLASLESKHMQLTQELTECSEGRDKVIEGAKQDDSINMDKEDELATLKGEKDNLLNKLDKLSRTKCKTPTTTTTEIMYETINIGDSWDADVQQLLDNTYRSNKRDSNSTP